ncbi:MAG: hypothetical protein SNJ67_08750 [Chloracidobacterium sp.]
MRTDQVTDSHGLLVEWIRNEFAAEQGAGFPRLKCIPDTRVVRFLDHFATLNAGEQSDLIAILADWSAHKFSRKAMLPATNERFKQATAFQNVTGGIRYTGVKLLAGLQKSAKLGGLPAWFQARGITGLAMQVPTPLARDMSDLVPVRLDTLGRQVKAAFARRFAASERMFEPSFRQYRGRHGRVSLTITVRYRGDLLNAQLHYSVDVKDEETDTAIPGLIFEGVLGGVGLGLWNYLTRENTARSVSLLCDLVEYVAEVPQRLPKCG